MNITFQQMMGSDNYHESWVLHQLLRGITDRWWPGLENHPSGLMVPIPTSEYTEERQTRSLIDIRFFHW